MQKSIIYVKMIHYTLETKLDGNVRKWQLCVLSGEIIGDIHSLFFVHLGFLKHVTCVINKLSQKRIKILLGKVRAGPQGTREDEEPRDEGP